MSRTTGACIPGVSTSGLGDPGGRSMNTWISHWVPLVITPIVGSGGRPGFGGGGPTGGGGGGDVTTAHCSDGGGGGGGPPAGGGEGTGGTAATVAVRFSTISPATAPTRPPRRAPRPNAPPL